MARRRPRDTPVEMKQNGRRQLRRVENIVVFTPYYPPAFRGGGPIRTLDALVHAAPDWANPLVVASDRDLGVDHPLKVRRNSWTTRNGVSCYYVSAERLLRLISLWTSIHKVRPAVLYFNSLFSPRFTAAPLLLHAAGWCRGADVLLAPRGELSPGALSLGKRKKQLAIALLRRLRISRKVVWHASTAEESAHIAAAFGDSARVLIRENETLLPSCPIAPSGIRCGVLRIVFLSRISPKKGLDILIEALRMAQHDVILDVFGSSDDVHYEQHCRRLASLVSPGVVVLFHGEVPNSEVRALLHDYDLFALPTAGENFGHVIVEALSASCPVMCTDQTPWTETLRAGGGVVVSIRSATAWADAIDTYARLSPDERLLRRQMAGRQYKEWADNRVDDHVFQKLRDLDRATS